MGIYLPAFAFLNQAKKSLSGGPGPGLKRIPAKYCYIVNKSSGFMPSFPLFCLTFANL